MARHRYKRKFLPNTNDYINNYSIEYTEQDRQRLKLVDPDNDLCKPIISRPRRIPAKATNNIVNNTNNLDEFEREYQEFIKKLKEKPV